MFSCWRLIYVVIVAQCEEIVIKTQLGQIKGMVHNDVGKQSVYSFYGIQYGVSPVGALRFRPAQMNNSKWIGINDGTKFGNVCMQYALPPPGQSMSEDCLHLNIWTPINPMNSSKLLPIMLWIHGGAFTFGAGSDIDIHGLKMVQQGRDFVYVSLNYRLGAFGFLSNQQLYHEDPDWKSYGGVNGFYDQIIALQYIQKYIIDYGGDPNQVTIFGCSAGGQSVCYLSVSPLAKGLFHRGIVESGACFGAWGAPWPEFGVEYCNAALVENGYPMDNMTYLRELSAHKLLDVGIISAADGLVIPQDIPTMYDNLGNTTHLNPKQMIIGSDTLDGVLIYGAALPSTDLEYKRFLHQFVFNSTKADLLHDYYYPPSAFLPYNGYNSYELAWITINSDTCLGCPSLLMANQISKMLGNDIAYVYQWGGPGINGSYYAQHGSEVAFVMDRGPGSEHAYDLPWNQKLSNQMLSAWTNFAKYGIPNITDDEDNINITWTFYNGAQSNVMIFEDKVRIKSQFAQNYRNNVCDFWNNEIDWKEVYDICLYVL